MSKTIKVDTYIKNQTINNYHYHGTEHSEPHTGSFIENADTDTDSIEEAQIQPVKQRTFSERNYPDTALKNKLLLALKGIHKAELNQSELREVVQADYPEMKSVLTKNPKLFSCRDGANGAGIWYLSKKGKRSKKKRLKALSCKLKGISNQLKAKDSNNGF